MDNLQVLTFQAQQQAQQRQSAEAKAFQDWATEQDNKFSQGNKDFADPVKAEKNRELVVNYLTKNLGIAQEKLPELWNSRMFRQAEMQRAIWDAARFANAQEKAKAAVAAPKPPVQRPGTASRQSPAQSEIQALNAQLNKATSVSEQLRISAAILAAERRAAKG